MLQKKKKKRKEGLKTGDCRRGTRGEKPRKYQKSEAVPQKIQTNTKGGVTEDDMREGSEKGKSNGNAGAASRGGNWPYVLSYRQLSMGPGGKEIVESARIAKEISVDNKKGNGKLQEVGSEEGGQKKGQDLALTR